MFDEDRGEQDGQGRFFWNPTSAARSFPQRPADRAQPALFALPRSSDDDQLSSEAHTTIGLPSNRRIAWQICSGAHS